MKNKSKGISPLVAAVLLIAATMSVAAVLAYWAQSFVEQKKVEWENQTANLRCTSLNFKIYECKYFNSTNKIVLTLESLQTEPLTNLAAYITYSDRTDSYTLNETLQPGALHTYANSITNVSSSFTRVIVKEANCPQYQKDSICVRS